LTVKTTPLWRLLSGPAQIELVPERLGAGVYGAKFAKLTLPVGKNTITVAATREVASAVQELLAMEVVEYDGN
jgi:hypothetical protein